MFQGSIYAGKTISVPTAKLVGYSYTSSHPIQTTWCLTTLSLYICAQISFHVTEMVVVPALKECSALMMDREATCVTVLLMCRNVKLNVIPIHVCINPHVL